MKIQTNAKIKLVLSMFIFGTIGIFVRYIPLPSGMIALARALIGVLFLAVFMLVTHKKINLMEIRNNQKFLIVSGALIGINWIMLFESYRYTTIATATLCYYLAPVFVMILSPFILKEKMTVRNGICILTALIGMILVSGVNTKNIYGIKGVLFGIGAAILYACVILCNKKIEAISSYDKTITQLFCAGVIMIPYILSVERIPDISISIIQLLLLVIVGIVHTGIAYTLYFASMKDLTASSIAIFSYIDPVVAIILSVLLLHENIGISGFIGAILILGATFFGSLTQGKEVREHLEDV